jgi:hypothetical protein
MHFLLSLLRIKGLYRFRALLANLQEALHKWHLVCCVRVMVDGRSSVTEGEDRQVTRMADALAQQRTKLQLETQAVEAQLYTNAAATKDLSLVALVPKWAGTSKTNWCRRHQFHSIQTNWCRRHQLHSNPGVAN